MSPPDPDDLDTRKGLLQWCFSCLVGEEQGNSWWEKNV